MSALLLSLRDIRLTFGGDALFEGADLNVGPGARIALVGRNGSGKSTLLKIAAGGLEPDAGERFEHPGVKSIYLPQEPDFGDIETAIDYVVAMMGLAGGEPGDLHLAERRLEDLGVAPDTALAAASGGEAKRISIAGALVSEPDILLLDEPTNHLDIGAIQWLEDELRAASAAIVLISHDRRFLETLTSETVWIDRGKTRHLDRGFRDFESWRDKALEEEQAARHKLGRKIAAEEDWVRYGVTARRKRNVRRMGELREMRKSLREERRSPGSVKFTATEARQSGKRAIVAENISKSFDGRCIVDGFSAEINRGEKVGLVAPNGAGKTTLLNMLIGDLSPDEGVVTLGANLEIISLDQRRQSLKPDMRLADAIADQRGDWVTLGETKRHVASYLQDFLFAPEQWRAPVSSLSGGERGRLALAAALAKPSNLLALDEPTNDLDLETLDLLEDLLADYQGALLLISHDRSFLDRIVSSVITTDPDAPGKWRRYPGGYDDMVAQRGRVPGDTGRDTGRDGARAAGSKSAPSTQKTPSPPEKKRARTKLSYKEQYALETLPEEIAALEAKIETLTAALADPALFEKDPGAFHDKAKALDAAKEKLAVDEEKWLTLEMKRDALEGGG